MRIYFLLEFILSANERVLVTIYVFLDEHFGVLVVAHGLYESPRIYSGFISFAVDAENSVVVFEAFSNDFHFIPFDLIMANVYME